MYFLFYDIKYQRAGEREREREEAGEREGLTV
jgi:hypothetical protein